MDMGNPPRGQRQGAHSRFQTLYQSVRFQLSDVTPGISWIGISGPTDHIALHPSRDALARLTQADISERLMVHGKPLLY